MTSDPNEVNIDNSIPNADTWKAVSALPKSKARSVGVSNFTYANLKALVDATGLVPAVNQIERHPLLPSTELVAYAREKKIHLTAYSAFGNNFFDIPLLITRPEICAIANKKRCTPAQVVLAWSQVGGHSVIPKSVTPKRISEKFAEVELSDDEIASIQKFSSEHQGRRRYNVPYTASKFVWDSGGGVTRLANSLPLQTSPAGASTSSMSLRSRRRQTRLCFEWLIHGRMAFGLVMSGGRSCGPANIHLTPSPTCHMYMRAIPSAQTTTTVTTTTPTISIHPTLLPTPILPSSNTPLPHTPRQPQQPQTLQSDPTQTPSVTGADTRTPVRACTRPSC